MACILSGKHLRKQLMRLVWAIKISEMLCTISWRHCLCAVERQNIMAGGCVRAKLLWLLVGRKQKERGRGLPIRRPFVFVLLRSVPI